jgi:hypothetical protein
MRELQKLVAASVEAVGIDGVIYLSERHATVEGQQLVLPLVAIRGPGAKDSPAKDEVLDSVMTSWAEWNGCPVIDTSDEPPEFEAVEVVPDRMSRSDKWRLDYRRSPHLRDLSDEQLKERFDEVIVVNLLWGTKSSPKKLDREAITDALECFTHVVEELNRRHIPMQNVQQRLAQLQQAARRLRLGDDVVEWLARVTPY